MKNNQREIFFYKNGKSNNLLCFRKMPSGHHALFYLNGNQTAVTAKISVENKFSFDIYIAITKINMICCIAQICSFLFEERY